MSHRIDLRDEDGVCIVEVQGVVDSAALGGLQRVVATASGRSVRVVLRFGSEVEPDCIEPLRRLEGAVVVAESPFLTWWLTRGWEDRFS